MNIELKYKFKKSKKKFREEVRDKPLQRQNAGVLATHQDSFVDMVVPTQDEINLLALLCQLHVVWGPHVRQSYYVITALEHQQHTELKCIIQN